MLRRGAEAAQGAAERDTAYELKLGDLSVSVRPVHRDNATSINLDVHGGDFTLSVTGVYNARCDARRASRLNLPADEHQNVQRIIEARVAIGEVCVFVSGSVPEKQPQKSIIDATRLIAAKLLELGLATERTLAVANIKGKSSILGTPMYTGSDVLVGTIGRVARPSSFTVPRGEALRLLFEGGAWAVQKDSGVLAWELPLAGESPKSPGEQPPTLSVQTAHTDTAGCVVAKTPDRDILLLVVHDALIHAEAVLLYATWWIGLDAAKAAGMMRRHVSRNSEIAIFAFSRGASGLGRVRSAMHVLSDLGLTAQQPHKDACVVLVVGAESNIEMEATRLSSLLGYGPYGPAELRLRETGMHVRSGAKKPKLVDTRGQQTGFGARRSGKPRAAARAGGTEGQCIVL